MKAQGGGWTKLQPVEISKHHPDYEEPERMKFFIGETILHHASIAPKTKNLPPKTVDKIKKKQKKIEIK